MMEDWLSIENVHPLLNKPVVIKTNWSTYLARLMPSEFGGVEFKVFDSSHIAQVTTVIGWKPAE